MTAYLIELSYTVIPIVVLMLGLAFIFREYLNHRANLLEKELTLLKASRAKSGGGGAATTGTSQIDSVRIQAYERLVLYLERISPDALIMRMHQGGMSANAFRGDLTKAVREEFEHNLSQQIYVSEGAWAQVLRARDETIKLIDIAHKKMNDKSTGLEMSRLMFNILSEVGKAPNDDALAVMRREARLLMQSGAPSTR